MVKIFDPKTGKKLWRETTVFNKQIFPDFENEDEYEDCCLEDLYIEKYEICSIGSSYENNVDYVVAMSRIKSGSNRDYYIKYNFLSLEPDQFKADFEKFKSTMEKYGLWTDTFGVYNVLYVSV